MTLPNSSYLPHPGRSWRLCCEDLAYSFTSLKGLIFLIPFGLFWFWTLERLSGGAASLLQEQQGLALAALLFEPQQAMQLFKLHSPTLSVYLLVMLYSLPPFVVIAAANQTAGDAGSGYFRFLLTRAVRADLFIGRFCSSLLLVALPLLVTGIVVMLIALTVDERPLAEIIGYGLQVNLIVLLYALALVSVMALFSASFSSARAALFAAFLFYVLVRVGNFIVHRQWPEVDLIAWLLPNHLFDHLVSPDAAVSAAAQGWLLLYVVVYLLLAMSMFQRRAL